MDCLREPVVNFFGFQRVLMQINYDFKASFNLVIKNIQFLYNYKLLYMFYTPLEMNKYK